MDLLQNKLSRKEWNSLEQPVSDNEKIILNIIKEGFTNLNIKYNIEDSNDLDELDDEDYEEEFNQQVNEFRTVFEDIKNGTMKQKIEPEKIKSGVVPQNILDKVKEQGPEIRSLLSQGES